MRRALCAVAVVLLSGCSTFGTGGIGDRYADERSQFVSEELALGRFPPRAIGVTAVPANSLSNDGPLAISSTVRSETVFYVADSVTSDDLTDFYVGLLARAGHRNIKVGCSDQSRFDQRRLTAAAWRKRYHWLVLAGQIGILQTRRSALACLFDTNRYQPDGLFDSFKVETRIRILLGLLT